MKKWILLAAICSLPLQLMAQEDDMYFVPTKENVAKEAETWGMPKKTYYSGSNRSVDDYNGRLSSSVTPVDSLGNEVETEDYQYTRQLSRFDDYSPSQAYWEGYRDGRWSSPWYYGRYGWYSSWYDPWYDPWYASYYDPWYNSWYYTGYYGWASPWRYGWYASYYRPWGYYRPYVVYRNVNRDGLHHVSAGGYRGWSNGSYARTQRRTTAPVRGFGQAPGTSRSSNSSNRSFGDRNGSNTRTFGSGNNSSGSSFGSGSNRSSGSSFGGGGGRSSGGGRSFGSRR